MDEVTLLNQFQNIRQASINGNRAPHKPLLLLYVLSRLWVEQNHRLFSFEEIDPKLTELLDRFYISKKKQNTTDPFTRLLADRIGWELKGIEDFERQYASKLSERKLLDRGVAGGFDQETVTVLLDQPNLILQIAHILLVKNFPESYFSAICRELGFPDPLKDFITFDFVNPSLEPNDATPTSKRDPNFRENVLNAYRRKCAFCGSSIRLRDTLVDLEAAHIRWHCYDGPDTIPNGLALCSSHHKLFDWGAIGLERDSDSYRILLAFTLNSSGPIESWLEQIRGSNILLPLEQQHWPDPTFVEWHQNQVFEKQR
ncbi:MAG: hypothetical protein F4Z01_08640 [Gammaproteobacteria bacterium]|nr:hypothetical protein [Gammaproteobacteria bacterium]MYF38777.1 hypothetical protein [Gammaproteobacteria bacterium]